MVSESIVILAWPWVATAFSFAAVLYWIFAKNVRYDWVVAIAMVGWIWPFVIASAVLLIIVSIPVIILVGLRMIVQNLLYGEEKDGGSIWKI